MRTAAIVVAALAAVAGPADAFNIVFPAPSSRAFVAINQITSQPQTCPDVQCTIVSSDAVPLALAPITFAPHPPEFISGSGSVGATTLRGSVAGNVGAETDIALRDTYTVGGTLAGPVPITITLSASGIASTVGNFLIGPDLTLTIGRYNVDPNLTFVPTVDPFDASSRVNVTGASIFNQPGSEPLSATVSYTRLVTVGEVFDVGYEMALLMARGALDFEHTATIAFDLPAGITLTSALAPVPEPAPALLLGAGLAALMLRRRGAARQR